MILNSKQMRNLITILEAVLLLGGATAAWTQERPPTPAPPPDRAAQIKNPVKWYVWGTDMRWRNDTENNLYLTEADPPGHVYSFERLRLREWNTFILRKGIEFNHRFTWEGRHYWAPDSKGAGDRSEIVWDNLNFKLRFQEIPVNLTVGRQDIVFGEGWLISDATPLDGPRTTYFDAVRATVDLKTSKSALDLIYIDQTASPNTRLRPIFSEGKMLMEQNERAALAYFSTKSIEHTEIDPYFIYKHDMAVQANGDTGNVYTLGSILARDFSKNVSGRVEGAYQFGTRKNATMFPHQDGALSAFGLNSRLTYSFRDPRKNQVWLGNEVFSGNDAHDLHNHQFDPLWGRWARYSELFPNDVDRTSDRSNLHRLNLGYQIEPVKGMPILVNYNAIFAYANRFAGTPGFSDIGRFKGHLFTALWRYQMNHSWQAYLLTERFLPGDYYQTPAGGGPLRSRKAPANFMRLQFIYTF